MLHCLSIAAKVRNGSSECDIVKDHAEIILSIVQNRSEALLPQEPLNSVSLRRLKDSLVKMERYSLALELSLKCGFSTSGVMAAWGISCLRAGAYETAREKFSHCMQKISTDEENQMLLSYIESDSMLNLDNLKEVTFAKRSAKSPPLLSEIIQILEATSLPQSPEVMARASAILNSNTSLSSSKSTIKKENIPLHEPALNILNTLANLKQIANGIHNDFIPERRASLMNESRSSFSR
jgi:zinc finger FYVE domain-containing protein 26